jgi:hypothetical protein
VVGAEEGVAEGDAEEDVVDILHKRVAGMNQNRTLYLYPLAETTSKRSTDPDGTTISTWTWMAIVAIQTSSTRTCMMLKTSRSTYRRHCLPSAEGDSQGHK